MKTLQSIPLGPKKQFFTLLSHEFRTPMTAIMGWAYMLKQGALPVAQQQLAVDTIIQQSQTLRHLIDGLLDYGRVITGELKVNHHPVDIVITLKQSIQQVLPELTAKKQIFYHNLPDSSVIVRGDAVRLQQIFTHLLHNAIKFTPAEGKIELQFHCVNGEIKVKIIDSGQGLASEFLPLLFEPTALSAERQKNAGLGVGLTVTHYLVQLHNGSITAESDGPDKGATFIVGLPLWLSSASTPATPSLELPDLTDLVVLIVDDEMDCLTVMGAVVQSCGGKALLASSSAEALRQAAHHHFDVLVSDIGMPGGDGYSLLRKLREAGYDMPAIAISGYTTTEDKRATLRAGFHDHVGKPCTPQELGNQILNAFRHRAMEQQRVG